MNKSGKQSLFRASLLACLLAAGLNAHAAGLGKLLVYSAIGQPLNAEVAVTSTPEELNSLSARLASHEAFRDAGIEPMPALAGLRFKVMKQPGGQAVLKLSTDRPLNEPFLHFLVELSWSSGRMVREYTFLLDPPEMLQVAKPASVAAPAVPAGQAVESPPVRATPLPSPAKPAVEAPVVSAGGSTEYRVKFGDSLGRIANQNQPTNVTLDQMLVALFNSNRDAFDGNNMNRLRAGKILRLPAAADVAAVEPQEARKIVVGQAADFNAYRRRLAEAAAAAAPIATEDSRQQAIGKVAPQVEERAPSIPVSDKLQVSKSESPKNGKSDDGRRVLEEDLIARDKALREANARIVDLEKNLENLKKLIELKSQAGVQVQQQAEAVAPPPKPAAEKKPEPVPVAPPAATAKPEEAAPAKPAVEAPSPPVAQAAAPESASGAEKSAAPPAAVPVPAEAPPQKAEVKKPAAPPPPPPELDFVEENPELVFGGGALLALLSGYFGFAAWRKKKQARGAQGGESGPVGNIAGPKATTEPNIGTELIDNGEISIQGDFSESGILTTEESVDPVAEADVLMAYGRDRQAEEILLEGLKADPTRAAIHLKLLELYANRKSTAQFEAVADQLHQINGGRGSDWDKAVSMARGLGMVGGLFAGEITASESEAQAEELPVVASPSVQDHEATAVMTSVDLPVTEPAAEEISSLEFDLDLGTTSAPAGVAVQEKSSPAASPEEVASLDFDFDLGTPEPAVELGGPSSALVSAEPELVAADDGNAIDFSIDIGSPVVESAVAEIPEAIPAVEENTESDIDFDLDLGVPAEADASPEIEGAAEEIPVAAPDFGDNEIAFDFDLGESSAAEGIETLAETHQTHEVPDAAAVLVADEPVALDLSAISLDLDEPEAESAPTTSPSAGISFDELALPALELPADEPVPEPVAEVDFDLALDIDDLPVAGDEVAQDVMAAEVQIDEPLVMPDEPFESSAAAVPEAESAKEADNPEVATKLELAQAYEEMGDLEGARELLNEVLGEGSPAQQSAARARLDQLTT